MPRPYIYRDHDGDRLEVVPCAPGGAFVTATKLGVSVPAEDVADVAVAILEAAGVEFSLTLPVPGGHISHSYYKEAFDG
jgi:hypothetical protein